MVNDGVASSSTTATSTLDTVHVAPTVTAGATATFTGGGPAVTLDGALTVSDVDSAGNLTGATVSIGAGFLAGDTLNFTNQNGITGSYERRTGVLTLTGTASARQLPDRARLDHLQLQPDQRRSDRRRRRHQPHHRLDRSTTATAQHRHTATSTLDHACTWRRR